MGGDTVYGCEGGELKECSVAVIFFGVSLVVAGAEFEIVCCSWH